MPSNSKFPFFAVGNIIAIQQISSLLDNLERKHQSLKYFLGKIECFLETSFPPGFVKSELSKLDTDIHISYIDFSNY